jgi:hypothetical protein
VRVALTRFVVLARIVPSSIRHGPPVRTARAGWVVREDALAVSARGCSGKRRGAGACRRDDQRGSVEGLDSARSARQPEDPGSNAFGIEPQSDQTAAAV